MTDPVRFVDLAAQQARLRPELDRAIAAVLDHGAYVSGPEVEQLESALGASCGADHVVACASGTDALVLALLARGIGPGDLVLVPSFTFAATAEAVALVGATPVFADVDAATCNLDPASVHHVVEALASSGRAPAALVAVDLFGLPADYPALREALAGTGAWILADGAQSFGASTPDGAVGTLAELTATSFFPAKPLGCYGDGGAVFARGADDLDVLRSLRVHGQGSHRYEHVRIGLTGRLDTIQAAVLLQKLTIFGEELDARRSVAARYAAGLADVVTVPQVPAGVESAWAQYTVVVAGDRDALAARLGERGVPTAVYYPIALCDQPAYASFPDPTGSPVARALAGSVLSLPMHPYLTDDQVDLVVSAVADAVERG